MTIKQQNKIYLLTSGSYSDYHVDAAFSSRENAEFYDAKFATGGSIEEFDIDPEIPQRLMDGDNYFAIDMRADTGEVISCIINNYALAKDTAPYPPILFHASWLNCDLYRFELIAKTQEHSTKIASEMRAEHLATNQFLKCANCNKDTYVIFCDRTYNKKVKHYNCDIIKFNQSVVEIK